MSESARCIRRMTMLAGVASSVVVHGVGAQSARDQPTPASVAGRALRIEDYYRIRTPTNPQFSPDGRWISFTVAKRDEATNTEPGEIWLASVSDATPARPVSPEGVVATAPRWEPDGTLRFRAGDRTLAVHPASPETVTEIARAESAPRAPAGTGETVIPGPGGRLNAVLREMRPVSAPRQFASDFERRHEERFKGRQFDWLDFQRDGQEYPVRNRIDPNVTPPQEIFLVEGGAERQLTRLGLRPTGLRWNGSGDRLLFTADSGYRDELRYGAAQVYSLSTTGELKNLTADVANNHTGASFSPDGRWVLYTRQLSTDAVIAQKLDHGGATDLVLRPANGGPERVLTADWDQLPSGATWSLDSRYVYFTGGVGGTVHLFRVATAGGPVQPVTRGERRILNLTFDRTQSRIAYTVGLIESPAELYVANVDGSGERRLTRLSSDFTDEVGLARAERLDIRSADGTAVEGWLLPPHGLRAGGGPYPLVVLNHGGPHAADGYQFDFKAQYLAASGYYVLRVNFRSSTGYGERFLWATWGAWGDKDGQDVMAGIDHVSARHPIDQRRIATMGHSYGGFMTNWLITQYPERFAAAIPGAGIVNWVSDYGTADIARTKETEFYGTPWNERARNIMIRQSPLTYADRVKAPTLFIHGEVDERVPYSEAEQFYVALKKNGVPAQMIQYADMPHGISGSWNIVHRMLSERRWLDRWLKPANAM